MITSFNGDLSRLVNGRKCLSAECEFMMEEERNTMNFITQRRKCLSAECEFMIRNENDDEQVAKESQMPFG